MKIKTLFVALVLATALTFSTNEVNAQDPQGTFIEESGEAQDSTKMSDILDYDLEYGKEKSNTGLIIAIVAVVVVGGGIVLFTRKKKK